MDSPTGGPPSPQPPRIVPEFRAPKAVSRTKEVVVFDEEMGNTIKLGEFQDVPSLSNSEARLVVNTILEHRKKKRAENMFEKENVTKIIDYLELFARFKQPENVQALERLLSSHHSKFSQVERSQLANLCCDTADEAKTLIPSITNRISDEDLQDLLDEINKLRRFVE